MPNHAHVPGHFALLIAVLAVTQPPAAQSADTPPAAYVDAGSATSEEFPTDYDGNCIIFPGDNAPEPSPGKVLISVEQVFSDDRISNSLAYARELHVAHHRLQEAFYQGSNLGSFAPSGNPYNLQTKRDLAKLPPTTVIEWKLTPNELIELDLPMWERIALGGANAHAFLAAADQYARYRIAELEIALMDCTTNPDTERRTLLETQSTEAKQAVIEFLQTPPAD